MSMISIRSAVYLTVAGVFSRTVALDTAQPCGGEASCVGLGGELEEEEEAQLGHVELLQQQKRIGESFLQQQMWHPPATVAVDAAPKEKAAGTVAVDAAPKEKAAGDGAKTPLKVAIGIVAPFGVRKSKPWRDAFAVLAHSVKDISSKSKHNIEILAIMPSSLPEQDKERKAFEDLGINLMAVPIPVPLDQVENKAGAEVLNGSLGENEQLKYYGAALDDYDRAVVLDADMIFLKPIDELLEATTGQYAMSGVYDHEMDMPQSTFPPVNSGFLAFAPNKSDFQRIVSIYRKGDIGGNGWDGSGTGWTYGTGSQGILSYYYNQVRPGVEGFSKEAPTKGLDYPGQNWTKQPASSRFLPQDRSVYNVVDTKMLQASLKGGHTHIDNVKVFHFAGGSCPKPWTCMHVPDDELCDKMTARWWELRKAVQEAHKLTESPQCLGETYTPLAIPDL